MFQLGTHWLNITEWVNRFIFIVTPKEVKIDGLCYSKIMPLEIQAQFFFFTIFSVLTFVLMLDSHNCKMAAIAPPITTIFNGRS